jgi:hypothetical protein
MQQSKDKVPVFRSWTYWYVLVILFQVLLIILFNRFTRFFE